MVQFLSEAWLAALDEAVRTLPQFAQKPSGQQLVVQQIVTGTPQGEVAYAIRFEPSTTSLTAGRDSDADVILTTDYSTAVAIARGDESAQAAFVAGRLRVSGDATALIRHQSTLAGLPDVFVSERAETKF